MFKKSKALAVVATISLFASSAFAGNYYVEAHGGFSTPPVKSIKDKKSNINVGIKKSAVFGGAIGYNLSDDISLELLFDHRPEYKADLEYKSAYGDYSEKTKFHSSSAMLNFVYNFKEYKGIRPFVSIGAGIAQLQIKEKKINSLTAKLSAFTTEEAMQVQGAAGILAARNLSDMMNISADGTEVNYNGASLARIDKVKTTAPSFQIGIGANAPISDCVSFGLSANFQVIQNVKATLSYASEAAIERNIIEMANGLSETYKFNKDDYETKAVKKTIGVVEIMASLKYDLPF